MTMKELFSQIRSRANKLNMSQKFGILFVTALIIAVFVVTMMWTMSPNYQYLFVDLHETDASLIMQKLKEERIPYKLTKAGSAIMIPEAMVYETRITLAGEGLPKGETGKGFALFDETGFSTSEFVQKINYQRALQNELANTIMSLEEVDFARVHITLPKESVFIEDEQPAKASIVIRPTPGRRIGTTHVQGIVYLIAKSVRGLEPENISIVDITGKVLYEGQDESDAISLASSQLELKRSIEQMLETRGQDLVDTIVGPGRATVKVSADVNMDMVKSVNDDYDPEGQVIRSEELARQFSADELIPAGIAGTESNLPSGRGSPQEIPDGAKPGESNVIRNYEITRTQTESIKSPGNITRLTISVVVDGIYKTDENGNRIFSARTNDELKGIENAVKYAVGFNVDRDDTISVSCMPFAQEETNLIDLSEAANKREFITSLIKPGIFLTVMLLLLFFVIRPVLRWLKGSFKVLSEIPNLQKALGPSETRDMEAIEAPDIEKALAQNEGLKQTMHGQRRLIETITDNDPESANAVIRDWLQERV